MRRALLLTFSALVALAGLLALVLARTPLEAPTAGNAEQFDPARADVPTGNQSVTRPPLAPLPSREGSASDQPRPASNRVEGVHEPTRASSGETREVGSGPSQRVDGLLLMLASPHASERLDGLRLAHSVLLDDLDPPALNRLRHGMAEVGRTDSEAAIRRAAVGYLWFSRGWASEYRDLIAITRDEPDPEVVAASIDVVLTRLEYPEVIVGRLTDSIPSRGERLAVVASLVEEMEALIREMPDAHSDSRDARVRVLLYRSKLDRAREALEAARNN